MEKRDPEPRPVPPRASKEELARFISINYTPRKPPKGWVQIPQPPYLPPQLYPGATPESIDAALAAAGETGGVTLPARLGDAFAVRLAPAVADRLAALPLTPGLRAKLDTSLLDRFAPADVVTRPHNSQAPANTRSSMWACGVNNYTHSFHFLAVPVPERSEVVVVYVNHIPRRG